MKTNGFNAEFYTALFKRLQFLTVFFFPLILSAQPNYNFQSQALISGLSKRIYRPSNGITDNIISKQIYVQSKYLQGNPTITVTKSNVDENRKSNANETRNPMLMKTKNPIQMKPIQFQYEKTENPMIPNPMIMKTRYPENQTAVIQFTFENRKASIL